MRPPRAPILLAGITLLVASCTVHNPNYEPESGTCTLGQRSCNGDNAMICAARPDPRWVLDRVCPAPSVCQQGVCVISGEPCQGTCDNGLVCTLFVIPDQNKIATYCAEPTGPKVGGQPCQKNEECQTSLCITGGRYPVCFRMCTKSRECPPSLRCIDAKVTVGSITGTIPLCIP